MKIISSSCLAKLLALVTLLSLGACTSTNRPDNAIMQNDNFEPVFVRPHKLYQAGLDVIEANYIHSVELGALTYSGLSNLKDIDSDIQLFVHKATEKNAANELWITNAQGSGVIETLPLPTRSDSLTLAKFTNEAVKAAKKVF